MKKSVLFDWEDPFSHKPRSALLFILHPSALILFFRNSADLSGVLNTKPLCLVLNLLPPPSRKNPR